jgi:hypothetical protein
MLGEGKRAIPKIPESYPENNPEKNSGILRSGLFRSGLFRSGLFRSGKVCGAFSLSSSRGRQQKISKSMQSG